jgi:hypothetical protein
MMVMSLSTIYHCLETPQYDPFDWIFEAYLSAKSPYPSSSWFVLEREREMMMMMMIVIMIVIVMILCIYQCLFKANMTHLIISKVNVAYLVKPCPTDDQMVIDV